MTNKYDKEDEKAPMIESVKVKLPKLGITKL